MFRPGSTTARTAQDAPVPSLRITRLAVGHGARPLIENVSFEVAAGEVVALIGPNGSGKTTLLRTIAGQLSPLDGRIELAGRPLETLSSGERARALAAMFTARPQTELLTCQDIVEMGRYPYTGRLGVLADEDHAHVRHAMEQTGIWELRARDFAHMSDGQRQRALIARALVQRTDVLLLDEPTSYLDIRAQLDMLQLLRDHARAEGVAVLASLHEIELAMKAADRVVCIRDGSIWAQGAPEEIFEPQRIEDLYGLQPRTFNGSFGSVELPRPNGYARVFVAVGENDAASYFRALQRHGIPFATGILRNRDINGALARSLATRAVFEQEEDQGCEDAVREALEVLRTCEALICCTAPSGSGDDTCAKLVSEANAAGVPVHANVWEYLDDIASD